MIKIEITSLSDDTRKIHAIKGLRSIADLSLRNAKDIVDNLSFRPYTVEVENHRAFFVETELREHYLNFCVLPRPKFSLAQAIGWLDHYREDLTVGELKATLKQIRDSIDTEESS